MPLAARVLLANLASPLPWMCRAPRLPPLAGYDSTVWRPRHSFQRKKSPVTACPSSASASSAIRSLRSVTVCGTLRCVVLAIVSLSQYAISCGAPVPFLRASAGFWRPVHHDGCKVFLNTPDTHSILQSCSTQMLSKTFHDVCVLAPATAQQDRHTRCLAFLVRGEKTAAALRTSAWHDTQHSWAVSATTCSSSVTRTRGKESFETCRACLPPLKNTHAHT